MQTEEQQIVLAGARAALGPLRADLVPSYKRWMNDPEVARGLGETAVRTLEAQQTWYDQFSRDDPGRVFFTVYDRRDLTPVGIAWLLGVDHHSGTASFGLLLGLRRGDGIGAEATKLVLEWAFTMLSLHNVYLTVAAWNVAGIKAYTKAGFRPIGKRRGSMVCMGRRYDEIFMDAVASEFNGSVMAALVPDGGDPA